MSLVGLKVRRHLALVAEHPVVDKRNTGYPVAMLRFSRTLKVVLTSCKVPHEVSPVHEVALVREEEAEVLPLCRYLYDNVFAATVIMHLIALHTTKPAFVSLSVCRAVHTREQHVLCIDELVLVRYDEVRVFLRVAGLLLTLPDRGTLCTLGHTHVAVNIECHLRRVSLSVEQRRVAILVAAEV